jgi:hypothetical protein
MGHAAIESHEHAELSTSACALKGIGSVTDKISAENEVNLHDFCWVLTILK